MGRQSARLYFQGKDHKDIYFNGHYHDQMYLSDGKGNVTLVWEKVKDNLFEFTVNPESKLILSVWGNVHINWGDGQGIEVNNNGSLLSHQYGLSDSRFKVQITGEMTNIKFNPGSGMNGALSEVLTILPQSMKYTKDLGRIFSGCTNLMYIPERIFYNCIHVVSMENAFWACTSLKNIPVMLFSRCASVEEFGGVFLRCSGLETIPEGLFAGCTKVKSFHNAFQYCQFSEIPEGLFAGCPDVEDFSALFFGCSKLITVPEKLFDNCPVVKDFSGLFCIGGLEAVPEGLFANCSDVENFASAFEYCQNIKGRVPELWRTHLHVKEHSRCFAACTKVSNYEEIPSTWK